MIEWGPLVKSLGYNNETHMWADLYIEKELSIAQISRKLDVSKNIIRSCLTRASIPIRSRGGPNNSKVVLTPELIDEIKLNGIKATATRLKMDYTTLYKRLRSRGITVQSLRSCDTTDLLDSGLPNETGASGPGDEAFDVPDIDVDEGPIETDPSTESHRLDDFEE